MTSLGTFADGVTYKEITPENYVEGPQMFKRGNKYYLMWSEGGWTGPNYAVSYGMSDSPTGPFARVNRVLGQDPAVARGSGHNSVLNIPGTDIWYIFYHRRPLNLTDANQRQVSYDRMHFDATVTIASGRGDAGVVFRATNPATGVDSYRGYYAGISAAGRVLLGKANNGWTPLASVPMTVQPGTGYHVRVEAVGATIRVYVDDMSRPRITVTDASYASGACSTSARPSTTSPSPTVDRAHRRRVALGGCPVQRR